MFGWIYVKMPCSISHRLDDQDDLEHSSSHLSENLYVSTQIIRLSPFSCLEAVFKDHIVYIFFYPQQQMTGESEG